MRHIKFGEGDYDVTENLIRELLADANPDVQLPPPSDSADVTPAAGQTPETYLGVGKMVNYGGTDTYDEGTEDFNYPTSLADDTFAYRGRWTLDYQGATAESDNASIALNYNAEERLHRRWRRGHRDRDTKREDHHRADQRAADVPPDRFR